MARSEFGRQIGFVESSLSSDEEEEEEVARGSEERDCQGDEDKEFGRGGEDKEKCRGGEDKEKCRGGEAQKLPRQGLVQLQPAVADLLVRFLHCTSGKENFYGWQRNPSVGLSKRHCQMHNGPKALSTLTNSTYIVQSKSFNKL